MGQVDFERLLAQDDRITVDVPSWGGEVTLERLSGPDWLAFADLMTAAETDESGRFVDRAEMFSFGLELVSRSIVDNGGHRVFDSPAGREKLGRYPREVIDLANRLVRFNGLVGGDETEAAKKK